MVFRSIPARESVLGVHSGCGGVPGRGEGVRLQCQIAVPGADGGALGYRPLLKSLAAGANHAPDFLAAPWRKHGFQMCVGASAGKARPDGARIKFFHDDILADLRRAHKARMRVANAAFTQGWCYANNVFICSIFPFTWKLANRDIVKSTI